ncbi:hypothetical protein TGGT1_315750 [Toxoplasma gondii GT1]|uniref:Uncharacterized protein n=3 Tax=Toxoplasma gondii TaxID=5811 RepID=S7W143_TOXGG|nr:hypothetical protein TGGT1_315750 [Toxoplasma gondii GT1]KAF4639689.1 hypothetical protein TGRH88_054610 [Toxoplasma gondii]RQX70876.1 hypothetical protein TGCAST_315750 [Toxoplasma gondii CAST]
MSSQNGMQSADGAEQQVTAGLERSQTLESTGVPQLSLARLFSPEGSFVMAPEVTPETPVRRATLASMPSEMFRSESLRHSLSSKSVAAVDLLEEMASEERVAIANQSGDYRVKLTGPDGEIPVNIWDLSLYPLWPFDHYQSLRREYLETRAKPERTPEEEKYIPPHPGVDYIYNDCPYVSHTGKMDFLSMSAHCILEDGSRLPADIDKSLRPRPFFSDGGSIRCAWFGSGK